MHNKTRIKTMMIACISATIYTCTHAISIDVQNNSDGQIQVLPENLAAQSLNIVNTNNPFAAIIYNKIKEETLSRTQEALERATTTKHNSGTSGSTVFDFCPGKITIKKLTGTGTGKEMSFTPSNCDRIKLVITNTSDGFNIQFQ